MSRTAHAHKPHEEAAHAEAAEVSAPREPREFDSVTITVDHLADIERHRVVKCVFSTESAQESLLAQIAYFNQVHLLRDPGIIAVANEGMNNDVVYTYVVEPGVLTNIIVDGPVFARILANSAGSVLEAFEQIILLGTDQVRHARSLGDARPIMVWVSPETRAIDEVHG